MSDIRSASISSRLSTGSVNSNTEIQSNPNSYRLVVDENGLKSYDFKSLISQAKHDGQNLSDFEFRLKESGGERYLELQKYQKQGFFARVKEFLLGRSNQRATERMAALTEMGNIFGNSFTTVPSDKGGEQKLCIDPKTGSFKTPTASEARKLVQCVVDGLRELDLSALATQRDEMNVTLGFKGKASRSIVSLFDSYHARTAEQAIAKLEEALETMDDMSTTNDHLREVWRDAKFDLGLTDASIDQLKAAITDVYKDKPIADQQRAQILTVMDLFDFAINDFNDRFFSDI